MNISCVWCVLIRQRKLHSKTAYAQNAEEQKLKSIQTIISGHREDSLVDFKMRLKYSHDFVFSIIIVMLLSNPIFSQVPYTTYISRFVSDYMEGKDWSRIRSTTEPMASVATEVNQLVTGRSHSPSLNRIFGSQLTSSAGRWMQRTSRHTSSRFSSSSESRMCMTRSIRLL